MPKMWLVASVAAVMGIGAVAHFGDRGLIVESAVAAPAGAKVTGQALQVRPTDRVMGSESAKVTVIEYASLTCPHCAHFHETTLPKLKQAYVDTGKVRFVFRDFPLDELAVKAHLLADCAPGDRYFPMLSAFFQGQQSWARSADPMSALSKIAKLGGMGDDQIKACLADKAREDAVLGERLEGANEFKIDSTPTFIVNGTRYNGALTIEDFDTILKPLT